MFETVGQLRIKEMFDIVVDYPDSRPAVQDVKDCLAHTNLHCKFVAGFKQAIGERLLHAGSIHRCMHACVVCTSPTCMITYADMHVPSHVVSVSVISSRYVYGLMYTLQHG